MTARRPNCCLASTTSRGRLAEGGGGGGDSGNFKALLDQETSRWSNAARQSTDQIKELRRQIQKLKDRGGAADEASPDLAQAIGESIGDALGKSGELKTVRMILMSLVFALAALYSIGVYLLLAG